MSVSIIIPAFNAADTIASTLESILAQRSPAWEAIVVDDGSTDATVAAVAPFLQRDPRFRLIRQANGGESAARNAGIREARFDWLAFLDADDWLLPGFLIELTQVRDVNPHLDIVHCGWRYLAPTGRATFDKFCIDEEQLFDVFAQYCGFAVNACIVRRTLVEAVGGFDLQFRACADWDFWQRAARAGARFGRVTEVLAQCRMRPDQASLDVDAMLSDGMRVVATGHTSDPRVARPAPAFADGRSPASVNQVRLEYLCGIAALCIGTGREAHSLLTTHFGIHDVGVNHVTVAYILFEKVPFSISRTPSAWPEVWERSEPLLEAFLSAMEKHANAPGVAAQVRETLLQLIVDWFGDTAVPSRALSPDHGTALLSLARIHGEYITRLRQHYQHWPYELQQAREINAVFDHELQMARQANTAFDAELQQVRQANAAFDHELQQVRQANAALELELQLARQLSSALEVDLQQSQHASAALELERQQLVSRVAEIDAARQTEAREFHAAIATLQSALKASETANRDLVVQAQASQATIRERDATIEGLLAELTARSDELARAVGEIVAIRQSRSWRFTAPLRSIVDLLSGRL